MLHFLIEAISHSYASIDVIVLNLEKTVKIRFNTYSHPDIHRIFIIIQQTLTISMKETGKNILVRFLGNPETCRECCIDIPKSFFRI